MKQQNRERQLSRDIWSVLPVLQVGHGRELDHYRLREGRLEFRPAGHRRWRELACPEIQQHFSLNTPVGKWLGTLYSTAELSKILLS